MSATRILLHVQGNTQPLAYPPEWQSPSVPQGCPKPNSTLPGYPLHHFLYARFLRLSKHSKYKEQNQELSSGNLNLHPFLPQSKAMGRGSVCRTVLKESHQRGGNWPPRIPQVLGDTRRKVHKPPPRGSVVSRLPGLPEQETSLDQFNTHLLCRPLG